MPSQRDALKRALVSLIRSLAQAFGCHVAVSRDSTDQEVRQAYRAVARKVHPDKPGGSKEEFQKLSAAHDAWSDVIKSGARAGRPPKTPAGAQTQRDDERVASVVLPETQQTSPWAILHKQKVPTKRFFDVVKL